MVSLKIAIRVEATGLSVAHLDEPQIRETDCCLCNVTLINFLFWLIAARSTDNLCAPGFSVCAYVTTTQWPSSWLRCRHTAALWSISICHSVCNSVFVFLLFLRVWAQLTGRRISARSKCHLSVSYVHFFSPQLKETVLFRSYRVHRKRALLQQKARPSVTITSHFCYDCSDLMLDAEVIELRGLDIFTLLSNRGWFSALTSSAADSPTEQPALVTF